MFESSDKWRDLCVNYRKNVSVKVNTSRSELRIHFKYTVEVDDTVISPLTAAAARDEDLSWIQFNIHWSKILI